MRVWGLLFIWGTTGEVRQRPAVARYSRWIADGTFSVCLIYRFVRQLYFCQMQQRIATEVSQPACTFAFCAKLRNHLP